MLSVEIEVFYNLILLLFWWWISNFEAVHSPRFHNIGSNNGPKQRDNVINRPHISTYFLRQPLSSRSCADSLNTRTLFTVSAATAVSNIWEKGLISPLKTTITTHEHSWTFMPRRAKTIITHRYQCNLWLLSAHQQISAPVTKSWHKVHKNAITKVWLERNAESLWAMQLSSQSGYFSVSPRPLLPCSNKCEGNLSRSKKSLS